MSAGVLYVLTAEGAHNAAGTALIGLAPDVSGAASGEFENSLPPCPTRWDRMFRQVTYTVSVVGTSGTAPTSWSLQARFEHHIAHTQGYQYSFGAWAPYQDEQLAQCILEGVGWYNANPGSTAPSAPTSGAAWGVIADSATTADDGSGPLPNNLGNTQLPPGGNTGATPLTARISVARTVVNQMGGTRVRLRPVIVGGDSTTRIICSAQALGIE